MTEKQEIFTPEFIEMLGKLKEFVEKISVEQAETPSKMAESATTLTVQEEPSKNPIEEDSTNSAISEIATNVAEILSQVQDFTYKDKINNELHKELLEYKNGLKESFNAPLLKAIVREYDRVNKQHRFYLKESQTEPQSELFDKLLSEFEVLSFALLNLLSDHDIEPFDFNAGDTHDIKLQKIVEVIETEDPAKGGTIAECVVCGFRNIETLRILRQAEIKVYKVKN